MSVTDPWIILSFGMIIGSAVMGGFFGPLIQQTGSLKKGVMYSFLIVFCISLIIGFLGVVLS